jgi:hypothetical protein
MPVAPAGYSNDIRSWSKTTQGSYDGMRKKSGIVTGTQKTNSAEHEVWPIYNSAQDDGFLRTEDTRTNSNQNTAMTQAGVRAAC